MTDLPNNFIYRVRRVSMNQDPGVSILVEGIMKAANLGQTIVALTILYSAEVVISHQESK